MTQADEKLVIAKSDHEIGLLPKMANRHGLIAGATGTGKTVTFARPGRGLQPDRRAGLHGGRQGGPVRDYQTGRR